MVDNI